MESIFFTKKWHTMLLVLSTLFVLASCDDSSDEGGTVTTPKIIQSEEILDNPITLAFSWEAVENAVEYTYQLEAVKEPENEVIVTGKTKSLNVEIASTKEAELFYSSEYLFTLKAVSSDASVVSEPAEARVTTSSGPIALSIENLTYRSALMKAVPEDKDMYYQLAQIPVETYTAYDSDMEFIEGYDFGYYKKLGSSMPWIPWYGFMQEGSDKGDTEYETRMLKPNQNYLMYAYGVEFDMQNDDDPVKIVTPMIKYFFTTPEWKATSNGTFTLSVENQELVEVAEGDYIVNIKLKVTPSNASERYYIAFVENSTLKDDYTMYDFAFDAIYSEEIYGGVEDWGTAEILSSGEKVLASMDYGWGIYPGTDYKILVFGVDNKGLVTTEIASIDCTTIGDAATKNVVRAAGAIQKNFKATKAPVSVIDRM